MGYDELKDLWWKDWANGRKVLSVDYLGDAMVFGRRGWHDVCGKKARARALSAGVLIHSPQMNQFRAQGIVELSHLSAFATVEGGPLQSSSETPIEKYRMLSYRSSMERRFECGWRMIMAKEKVFLIIQSSFKLQQTFPRRH